MYQHEQRKKLTHTTIRGIGRGVQELQRCQELLQSFQLEVLYNNQTTSNIYAYIFTACYGHSHSAVKWFQSFSLITLWSGPRLGPYIIVSCPDRFLSFVLGQGKKGSGGFPYVVLCNRERPKSGSYFNLPRTVTANAQNLGVILILLISVPFEHSVRAVSYSVVALKVSCLL